MRGRVWCSCIVHPTALLSASAKAGAHWPSLALSLQLLAGQGRGRVVAEETLPVSFLQHHGCTQHWFPVLMEAVL